MADYVPPPFYEVDFDLESITPPAFYEVDFEFLNAVLVDPLNLVTTIPTPTVPLWYNVNATPIAVSAGIPTGFTVTGDSRWLALDGQASPGASASTPDATGVRLVNTDFTIVFHALAFDWNKLGQPWVSKWADAQDDRGWIFQGHWANGYPGVSYSWDGTYPNYYEHEATAALPFKDFTAGWVAVTVDVDNGSSQHEVKFWYSYTGDASSWTQLGSTITYGGTGGPIAAAGADVFVGRRDDLGGEEFRGFIYEAQVWEGIRDLNAQTGGTLKANPRFDLLTQWPDSTPHNDAQGNTWTLQGNAWIDVYDYNGYSTPVKRGTPVWTTGTSDGQTLFTVNFVTGLQVGDLIAVVISVDGNTVPTAPLVKGLTRFKLIASQSATTALVAFWVARVTHLGYSYTGDFSLGVGEGWMGLSVGVRGSAVEAVTATTASPASSSNWDPPAHTPAYGSANYYWLCAAGSDIYASLSGLAAPANYALIGVGGISDATALVWLTAADRTYTGSTDDPGSAVRGGTSDNYGTFTASFRPTAFISSLVPSDAAMEVDPTSSTITLSLTSVPIKGTGNITIMKTGPRVLSMNAPTDYISTPHDDSLNMPGDFSLAWIGRIKTGAPKFWPEFNFTFVGKTDGLQAASDTGNYNLCVYSNDGDPFLAYYTTPNGDENYHWPGGWSDIWRARTTNPDDWFGIAAQVDADYGGSGWQIRWYFGWWQSWDKRGNVGLSYYDSSTDIGITGLVPRAFLEPTDHNDEGYYQLHPKIRWYQVQYSSGSGTSVTPKTDTLPLMIGKPSNATGGTGNFDTYEVQVWSGLRNFANSTGGTLVANPRFGDYDEWPDTGARADGLGLVWTPQGSAAITDTSTVVETISVASTTVSGRDLIIPISDLEEDTDYHILIGTNVITNYPDGITDPRIWNFHTFKILYLDPDAGSYGYHASYFSGPTPYIWDEGDGSRAPYIAFGAMPVKGSGNVYVRENNYRGLHTPATPTDYISTPHHSSLLPATDFSLMWYGYYEGSWPADGTVLIAKSNGFGTNTGAYGLILQGAGGTDRTITAWFTNNSDQQISHNYATFDTDWLDTYVSAGVPFGVGVTVDVDDGASGHVFKWWVTENWGMTWTNISTYVGSGAQIPKANDTYPLRIGANAQGGGAAGNLVTLEARVYDGIHTFAVHQGGTLVANPIFHNPSQWPDSNAHNDALGRTWTPAGSAVIRDSTILQTIPIGSCPIVDVDWNPNYKALIIPVSVELENDHEYHFTMDSGALVNYPGGILDGTLPIRNWG